jgi:hypothetical protein
MSMKNGDRSRAGVERKKKQLRRKQTQQLRKDLASKAAAAAALPVVAETEAKTSPVA